MTAMQFWSQEGAIALAPYPQYAAGLHNVATILVELAEHIEGKDLIGIAGDFTHLF